MHQQRIPGGEGKEAGDENIVLIEEVSYSLNNGSRRSDGLSVIPISSDLLDLSRLNPNAEMVEPFLDPARNQEEVEQSKQQNYWSKGNSASKWNRVIENERKGRFTQQEQKILSTAVGEFLASSQITFDEFLIILNEKNIVNNILKQHKFFNILSNLLPNRSAHSCYRFLKRSFNSKNRKGKWSIEEEKQLISLVGLYGRQWTRIGKQMGRTSDNVYDKYRSMGSEHANKRKKCSWTLKELVDLLSYVNKRSPIKFLDEGISLQLQDEQRHNIHDHLDHQKAAYNTQKFILHNFNLVLKYLSPKIKEIPLENINWSIIADKITTRSFIDCKNKFFQIMEIVFREEKVNNFRIIEFIEDQKVNKQEEIDWRQWHEEQFSSHQAKNRFFFLKKMIPNKTYKKLSDLLPEFKLKLNNRIHSKQPPPKK